jgi:hypothetical protein
VWPTVKRDPQGGFNLGGWVGVGEPGAIVTTIVCVDSCFNVSPFLRHWDKYHGVEPPRTSARKR